MADSLITVKDAGDVTRNMDTQDVGGTGQHQQVVCIGEGANAGRVMAVDAGGSASVRERATSTATLLTPVTASTSSQTLAASNSSRRGLMIHNDSADAVLYVRLDGGTASSSGFSFPLDPGDTWEMEHPYTGAISGAWSAASGSGRVTEFS